MQPDIAMFFVCKIKTVFLKALAALASIFNDAVRRHELLVKVCVHWLPHCVCYVDEWRWQPGNTGHKAFSLWYVIMNG